MFVAATEVQEKFRIIYDDALGISILKYLSIYQVFDYYIFSGKDIRNWLSPIDTSGNYNEARKKYQDQTGSWFIQGKTFNEWKGEVDKLLWIYGKSEFNFAKCNYILSCVPVGCGKTILWYVLLTFGQSGVSSEALLALPSSRTSLHCMMRIPPLLGPITSSTDAIPKSSKTCTKPLSGR